MYDLKLLNREIFFLFDVLKYEYLCAVTCISLQYASEFESENI